MGPENLGAKLCVVIVDGEDRLEGCSDIRYVFKGGSHIWVDEQFTRLGIRRISRKCRRIARYNQITVKSVQLLPIWKGAHQVVRRRRHLLVWRLQ